jgi:hypothetical protein
MTVKLPAIDNLDAKEKPLFMERKKILQEKIESLRSNPNQIIRVTDLIEQPENKTENQKDKK